MIQNCPEYESNVCACAHYLHAFMAIPFREKIVVWNLPEVSHTLIVWNRGEVGYSLNDNHADRNQFLDSDRQCAELGNGPVSTPIKALISATPL